MPRTIKGIVHDRHIELEEEPGLPSGTPVNVVIEAHKLSLEKRRCLVRKTAGSWSGDASVEVIFARIIEGRLQVGKKGKLSVDLARY